MTYGKIDLNWTPNANAVTQKVQRAESNSGPWTTLATLSATASSYTDNSVVTNPHTDYYYRIETTCSSGTDYSTVIQEEARCCPEDNKSYVFEARDNTYENVNGQTQSVYIKYKDGLFNWINNTYGSSKNITRSVQLSKGSNFDIRRVFCALCSELFELDTTNPNSNNTLTPQVTYKSEQASLISQMPTPPTAFGGDNYYNLGNYWGKQIQPANILPSGDQIQFGFANSTRTSFTIYTGKYVKLGTVTGDPSPNQSIVNHAPSNISTQDFSHAGAPFWNTTTNAPAGYYYEFNAVRLPVQAGRYHTTSGSWGDAGSPSSNTSHPTRNFSTAFSSIPTTSSLSGNVSNSTWRIAIFDTGFFNVSFNHPGRCLVYPYKISRNSNYDVVNSNNVITHYGFDLHADAYNVSWSNSTNTVTYWAHSMVPWQTGDPLPYNGSGVYPLVSQPDLIIKFMNS